MYVLRVCIWQYVQSIIILSTYIYTILLRKIMLNVKCIVTLSLSGHLLCLALPFWMLSSLLINQQIAVFSNFSVKHANYNNFSYKKGEQLIMISYIMIHTYYISLFNKYSFFFRCYIPEVKIVKLRWFYGVHLLPHFITLE